MLTVVLVPGARALPRVLTRISVGDGAFAEWLPQKAILFDGSATDRCLDVHLSDSSWFAGGRV